jgi:formylglycine-generating enzyme required for sulfatase activity
MRTQTVAGRALQQARENTDALFRLIKPGFVYQRPISERHRMIFYLGHLEAFDWNLIARYALDVPAFQPEFDRLFAFGIDPPPGQLPSDTPSDWPSLEQVELYVRQVRDTVDSLIAEVPEQLRHVAIEHRLMHAETLAYILHQLPYAQKVAEGEAQYGEGKRPDGRWLDLPSGMARLGMQPSEGFGWDNEFPPLCVPVPAFTAAQYKVTNREYLEFVAQGAAAPYFWGGTPKRRTFRGMFEEYRLPLDAPVYCTQEEAAAYAAWKGKRLPTEAEAHRLASAGAPSRNLNFRYWDPIAVTADDVDEAGPARPMQTVGNGWEWTSSVFAPFPGFTPFPFYSNYSEPFFDGRHYVLKGASPRTAECFLRPSFRNWFRPSYPYVYATFRLVAS